VRLLDVAGPGSVTVELLSTGQRITISESSGGIELVAEAPKGVRE